MGCHEQESTDLRADRPLRDAELQFFDGGHLFFLQDPLAWPAVADFLTLD